MDLGTISSVENGYAVFLQEVQETEHTQRVHLYRLSDGRRATLDPLSQVPNAKEVNLNDVSVGESGLVAVAANAILETEPALMMVGLLVLYDTQGNLVSAQRLLGSGQSIRKLKVDDDGTVWAVSSGAKSADPTTAPFLYKYTNSGATASVLYTRASLPEINWLKPYVRGIGTLAFGTLKESVYCWVPELQETVIMASNGSGIRRVPLAAPRPPGAVPSLALQSFGGMSPKEGMHLLMCSSRVHPMAPSRNQSGRLSPTTHKRQRGRSCATTRCSFWLECRENVRFS